MILYAESSAILRWLLGAEDGDPVRAALGQADHVFASRLTLIECGRVLTRAVAEGRLSEGDAARVTNLLAHASGHWRVLEIGAEVATRAGRPFPLEPVRTLDAIHLASALWAARLARDLAVLSVDRRLRDNASALGLALVPPGA